MKTQEAKELINYIQTNLDKDVSECQESIISMMSDKDRTMGFCRLTDELVDIVVYKILFDIEFNGMAKFVVNFNDDDINEYAYKQIVKLVQKFNIMYIDDMTILDDLLVLDYVMITQDHTTLSEVDTYYIYDLMVDTELSEVIESILDDKSQLFHVFHPVVFHPVLSPYIKGDKDLFVYTSIYSDYHNCNCNVLQGSYSG